MDEQKANSIIHELSSMGQSCKSYEILLGNPSIMLNRKKMKEICGKMAKFCLEIRNSILEEVR